MINIHFTHLFTIYFTHNTKIMVSNKEECYLNKVKKICNSSGVVSMIKSDMLRLHNDSVKAKKVIKYSKTLYNEYKSIIEAQEKIVKFENEYKINMDFMRMYINLKLRGDKNCDCYKN